VEDACYCTNSQEDPQVIIEDIAIIDFVRNLIQQPLSMISTYSYIHQIVGDHQYKFGRMNEVFHSAGAVGDESTMRQYISYSQTSGQPMIQLGGKYWTIFS
jgi:hypothetical protein